MYCDTRCIFNGYIFLYSYFIQVLRTQICTLLLRDGYLKRKNQTNGEQKRKGKGEHILKRMYLPDGIVEQAPLPVILFFIEVSSQPLERQNPSGFCCIFLAECRGILSIPLVSVVDSVVSTIKSIEKSIYIEINQKRKKINVKIYICNKKGIKMKNISKTIQHACFPAMAH
jgi:hypothetical protein